MKLFTLVLNWTTVFFILAVSVVTLVPASGVCGERPVGIIDGADGPTTLFISPCTDTRILLPMLFLALLLLMNIRLISRR